MRFYVRELNMPKFDFKKLKILKDKLLDLQVIKTPGHLRGSICVYGPKNQYLFSGDTVFADGIVGRTDLAGSDPSALKKSLKTLSKLKLKLLCPGHGQISNDSNVIAHALEKISRSDF